MLVTKFYIFNFKPAKNDLYLKIHHLFSIYILSLMRIDLINNF